MDVIASPHAPQAIGPYSQAIRAGNLLFTSGQVALDPATGNLVDTDFAAQVRQVFENLKNVLAAAGATFANVTKATVFLRDMNDFQVLNTVYAEYFGAHKPARTTVAVSGLPKGASVEVDLVAVV